MHTIHHLVLQCLSETHCLNDCSKRQRYSTHQLQFTILRMLKFSLGSAGGTSCGWYPSVGGGDGGDDGVDCCGDVGASVAMIDDQMWRGQPLWRWLHWPPLHPYGLDKMIGQIVDKHMGQWLR